MTVADLVVELMAIENQSLPVVWEDSENGITTIGNVSERVYKVSLGSGKGCIDSGAVLLHFGDYFEDCVRNEQANRP